MTNSVRERVCVVTGASSGIGRQIALDLAEAGAKVVAAARREDRLQELLAEMGGEGRGHSYFITDVAERAQVKALCAAVQARYERCDVLINNAGMNMERPFRGPEYLDALEKVMAVNFFGAAYCTAEFLELLERSAPSNIVNITSFAGRLAVGASAYTASKFALVGWSESLFYELAERGIYVSSIEPGFIPTEGFPQTDLKKDKFMRYALGTVEQVSKAVLDAIEGNKMQRVVPRWYYALSVPRLMWPAAHRYVIKKVVRPMATRRSS